MHLYIAFPRTLLYLRNTMEMTCLWFFPLFLFVLWNGEIKENLTLRLSDKLCQLLLVMPNYESNV